MCERCSTVSELLFIEYFFAKESPIKYSVSQKIRELTSRLACTSSSELTASILNLLFSGMIFGTLNWLQ